MTSAATDCNKCSKPVFPLEKIVIDGRILHEGCFICDTCNCKLNIGNYSILEDKYFCVKDFYVAKRNKPSGSSSTSTNRRNNADTALTKKSCPICKKRVFTIDGITAEDGQLYHRNCFVCSQCGEKLSPDTYVNIDQKLLCPRHGKPSDNKANPPDKKTQDDSILEDDFDEEFSEHSSEKTSSDEFDDDSLSHDENLDAVDPKKSESNLTKSTGGDDKSKKSRDDKKKSGSSSGKRTPVKKKDSMVDLTVKRKRSAGDKSSEKTDKEKRKKEKRDRSKEDKRKKLTSSTATPDKPPVPKLPKSDKKSTSTSKKNSPRVQKKDSEPLDTPEKSKKGRGIFFSKRRTSSPNTSASPKTSSGSSTPSLKKKPSSSDVRNDGLGIFRWRKPPKAKEDLSGVPTSVRKDDSPESSSEEEFEPLNDVPEDFSHPKSTDSKFLSTEKDLLISEKPESSELSQPEPPKVYKPVNLNLPSAFSNNSFLPISVNLDEDGAVVGNVPDLAKSIEWKSYELKRELSPVVLELPEELLPAPKNEHERILQDGFFEPAPLVIGIIGIQYRLLELLGILFSQYPRTVKIRAVSLLPEETKNIIVDRYGQVEADTNPYDLLKRPEIDWVFIGSINNQCSNHIVAALEAGKNVFCERPIGLDVNACINMKNVHLKSGRHFLAGYVWRFVPFYVEINKIIQSGILGKIISVEVNNLLDPSQGGYLMSDWTRKKELAGTILFETACNEVDILSWLFNSLPSRVGGFSGLNVYTPDNKPLKKSQLEPYLDWEAAPISGASTTHDPFSNDKDVEDNFSLIIEFRNQVRGTFHINTNSAFPQKRLLICGLNGTLEGDLYTGLIRYKTIDNYSDIKIVKVSPGASHGGSDSAMMEDLMNRAMKKITASNCCEGEEIFLSVVAALGIDQAKKGVVVDLEPYWKQLGL